MLAVKTHKVKFISDSQIDPAVWERISPLFIENYPWDDNGYRPETEVRIFYTETKLHLQFKAYEKEIRAKCLNMNDPVCTDSCVEFFFNPDPKHDERYMNFEINPIGTLLLGIGKDRYSRSLISDVSANMFNILTSVDREYVKDYNKPLWIVEYSIPFTFIEKYYGKQDFSSGKKMRGNFQKCGDKTKFPHYGCWNRIEAPEPNFHKPECFGDFILD